MARDVGGISVCRGAKLPRGRYTVVDPLAVLSDSAWNYVACDLLAARSAVAVKYCGLKMFVWVTKFGDGVYPIYSHGRPWSNARTGNCLLCIAPVAMMGEEASPFYIAEAGEPTYANAGDVRHGEFEIVTSGVA